VVEIATATWAACPGSRRGSMGHPSAAKPEQVDQLLEEMKELVEQLKAERGKAKKGESR
jgi:hypothetical protein